MSRRTIGGGRVLGSGRTLGPPVPPSKPTSPSALPTHVLSPSASTLSLDTSGSGNSTPPSSDPQDIASRVSLDHGAPNLSLAAATDRMVCPICNEEMVTLLQLNRHLDDAHKEIEERQQDEAKDWFKQQMVKAKKFQPLAVLNQKLKGLDVFESNQEVTRTSTPVPRNHSISGDATTVPPPPPPKPAPVVDPEDIITKQHWQRRTGYDGCSDPTCERRLGGTNGSINCRHCGKLFCDEHTMYQMKLSRSAQHEPVRGLWYRVCETCYKSREGYTDRHGLERDRTSAFETVRRNNHSSKEMEVSRLEKRLTRLTQLLANPPDEIPHAPQNKRWSISWGQTDPRKTLEQSIVSWQNDADVPRCPYCQQDFSQYTFRRHHCRTCGKVVCGDPATGCSTILPLNVATSMSFTSFFLSIYTDDTTANNIPIITEKPAPNNTVALDIRLCKDCNHTIFSRRDFEASLTSPQIESFSRSYHNLLQFERGIRLLMPRFQKLLTALQDPDHPPSSTQIADASRTRKRLMDSFTQYDTAARRIRDMPSPSPTQLKLQKAIYQNATQFLHLHMLPLKSLPKVLKHATPYGSFSSPAVPTRSDFQNVPNPRSSLAALNAPPHLHGRHNSSSALSLASSVNSARISDLETEEKQLRERPDCAGRAALPGPGDDRRRRAEAEV